MGTRDRNTGENSRDLVSDSIEGGEYISKRGESSGGVPVKNEFLYRKIFLYIVHKIISQSMQKSIALIISLLFLASCAMTGSIPEKAPPAVPQIELTPKKENTTTSDITKNF
jgi:hypothetical protein